MENTPKSRFRKKRWLLLIDVAITLIILLVTLILLRHRPADYNPASAFDKQVSPYLTHRLLPDFYNNIQRKEPFELVIEQNGINEAIASLGWPQMHNGLIISTPKLVITPQHLRLMTLVNYDSVDTVVTVEVVPRFDNKGLLTLEVQKVNVGALGVTFIAKKMAKKKFDEEAGYIEPDNIVASALASMMADQPFEPLFDFEGRRGKVDNVILENQTLRMHIIPLGDLADGNS